MRLQLWCFLPCSSHKKFRHARMKDGVLILKTSPFSFRHQMVCLKWHAPLSNVRPRLGHETAGRVEQLQA